MRTIYWEEFTAPDQCLHIARAASPHLDGWQMHKHDFFECFLVESGQGTHVLSDNSSIKLKQGDIVFLRPEHAHSLRPSRSSTLSIVNIALESVTTESILQRHTAALPTTDEIWQENKAPAIVSLPESNLQQIDSLLTQSIAGGRKLLDTEFFLTGLLRILRSPTSPSHSQSNIPDWLSEAMEAFHNIEQLRAGVPALVRSCGRSSEHVARSFQKHMACTPSQWVSQERLKHAAKLLETTQLNVTEIALEVGFESLSLFHRRFKTAYDFTPNQFRKRAVHPID